MQNNRSFYLSAFVWGLLFALGLGLSGMMDPRKVQGFLDLFGRWDPSLSLVMGGAVAVTLLSFPLIFRRSRPLLDTHFALPTATRADVNLLAGSGLFGAGWAISGMCPGPGQSRDPQSGRAGLRREHARGLCPLSDGLAAPDSPPQRHSPARGASGRGLQCRTVRG